MFARMPLFWFSQAAQNMVQVTFCSDEQFLYEKNL